MNRIQFDRDDIKRYLEETDENGRKVNTNYSAREKDFIINIKKIETLKDSFDEKYSFFEILRKLDKMMLGEEADGRTVAGKYGYLSEAEVADILKWIFVERYIVAHMDDSTDENTMNTALQNFISTIYDSEVHFFEEILQNIDDAIGRTKDLSEENNIVDISWKDKEITFTYPDRGFSFYDLMAITSLGNSMKKGDLEHASIGEKGIGFKSVFGVAKQVDITSRYFSFGIKYERERKTSVLQPDYIELNGSGVNKTELKITFFDEFAIEDKENKAGFKTQLWKWLFENEKQDYLNYSPFLFLKNVKKVFYSEDNKRKEIVIRRNTIEGTELFLTNINSVDFLLYKKSLKFDKELIANRWGVEYVYDKSEDFSIDRPIEIAFPIVTDGEENNAKEKKGLFYSFLPTEMVIDNPIYINVDVHLKSSRGRISNNDLEIANNTNKAGWNKYVADNLHDALKEAYMAVINNKNNETVWKVAKKLYLYMQTSQKTTHYFGEILRKFSDNIKNEGVYLNCKREFVANNDIWGPNIKEDEWNDFIAFCLGNPLPEDGENRRQYAYDYEWYVFSKKLDKSWKANLINLYKGIEDFYINSDFNVEKKNEVILWLLEDAMKSNYNKSEWKILFIEDKNNECGYRITSKKEIEDSNKTVFFHNPKEDIDDELSIYIHEDVFVSDEDKKKYKVCLNRFVSEKDWDTFLENKLKKLAEQNCIDIETCFYETYKYVPIIKYVKKVKVPEEINKLACKVVLPADMYVSVKNEGEKVYLSRIAEHLSGGVGQKHDEDGEYRLFKFKEDISKWDEGEVNRYCEYLFCLGCKSQPEIIENSYHKLTYDELTKAIMPDYANTTTDPNTLRFVFDGDDGEKKLKEYLVDFSLDYYKNKENLSQFDISVFKNFPYEKIMLISPEILKNGFTITIQTTGPQGGTSGYPQYYISIKSFRQIADDDYLLFNGNKERLSINSGNLIFADNQYYYRVFSSMEDLKVYVEIKEIDYISEKKYTEHQREEIIKRIINSSPEDMLDKIRWLSIWNKVFGVRYGWPNGYPMDIPRFLSCYEYIGRKDIDSLFEEGYTVKWPDNNTYYDACVSYEVKEYLCGEFEAYKSEIENIDAKKYCAIKVRQNFEKNFLSLERYGKLVNKGNYSHLIFVSEDSVNKKRDKTDYVIKILNSLNISLNDAQQMELSDILGEISNDKKKKIIEIQEERTDYIKGMFNDESNFSLYSSILEKAKKDLPSVWEKDKNTAQASMKIKLCRPYVYRDVVFQGYGYQCPICGSMSKIHSLSGLKFLRRLKNSDVNSNAQIPYLHLVTCLNCSDMLEGATKIALKDYDGKNLVESIKHFEEVCYCADQYHMYNNSKMKTMKLIMEIEEQEFVEDIKVSFLHLALFAKLLKNT